MDQRLALQFDCNLTAPPQVGVYQRQMGTLFVAGAGFRSAPRGGGAWGPDALRVPRGRAFRAFPLVPGVAGAGFIALCAGIYTCT